MKNQSFTLFSVVFFLFVISACSKDDEEFSHNTDITNTSYEVGKEYTRIFYFGSHAISSSPENGIHAICYFTSECERLGFMVPDYENDAPSNELRSKIINLQSNDRFQIGKLDYFLVADFRFIYGQNTRTKVNEWKIIIGYFEEYAFENKIYKRLVVKEEYKE